MTFWRGMSKDIIWSVRHRSKRSQIYTYIYIKANSSNEYGRRWRSHAPPLSLFPWEIRGGGRTVSTTKTSPLKEMLDFRDAGRESSLKLIKIEFLVYHRKPQGVEGSLINPFYFSLPPSLSLTFLLFLHLHWWIIPLQLLSNFGCHDDSLFILENVCLKGKRCKVAPKRQPLTFLFLVLILFWPIFKFPYFISSDLILINLFGKGINTAREKK